MKQTAFILFFLATISAFAQNQCYCEKKPELNKRISCDTIILKDKSLIFYQLNCDSLWLTLKNGDNNVHLFSMGTEWAELSYRLGYQFTQEFKNSLLFRWGCPANGPCNYVLIDKKSGEEIEQLRELVFQDSSANFIIYFTDSELDSLTLHYIDSGKKYIIAINSSKFTERIPEFQFENRIAQFDDNISNKSFLKDNILTLRYYYKKYESSKKSKTGIIKIDLKKYKP